MEIEEIAEMIDGLSDEMDALKKDVAEVKLMVQDVLNQLSEEA